MVIVHVVNDILHGGVATMVRDLITEQIRKGYKVAVVTEIDQMRTIKNVQNMLPTTDVRIYQIEKWRLIRRTISGGLSKLNYRKIQKDYNDEKLIVHFHNPIACGLCSYMGNSRVICTIHGYINRINQGKLTRIISNCTVAYLNMHHATFVGCAEGVAKYSEETWPKARFESIMNGICERTAGKNLYVKNTDLFNIGYAANLDELKGWKYLADGFMLIPKELRSNMHLYFAGSVYEKDKEELMEYVDMNKDSVTYLGEIENAQSVFFPYLDVMVLPSRTEGLPMSILEAMQASCIPFVTPVGGIPEIVEDGRSGFFIKRDKESIADKLVEVYNSERLRHSLKSGALQRYLDVGTAKRMADEYEKLYLETE